MGDTRRAAKSCERDGPRAMKRARFRRGCHDDAAYHTRLPPRPRRHFNDEDEMMSTTVKYRSKRAVVGRARRAFALKADYARPMRFRKSITACRADFMMPY